MEMQFSLNLNICIHLFDMIRTNDPTDNTRKSNLCYNHSMVIPGIHETCVYHIFNTGPRFQPQHKICVHRNIYLLLHVRIESIYIGFKSFISFLHTFNTLNIILSHVRIVSIFGGFTLIVIFL